MMSLEFFIDIILPAALWPWSWLSLLQKWVPGIFSSGKGCRCVGLQKWVNGGKGCRCVGLTNFLLSCADCLEIWELQLPENISDFQACNGIALPSSRYCIDVSNHVALHQKWFGKGLVMNLEFFPALLHRACWFNPFFTVSTNAHFVHFKTLKSHINP